MSKKFVFNPDKRDPDDPTTTRDNRARAAGAIKAVICACKLRDPQIKAVTVDDDEICDLFTDMCHLCDRLGYSAHKIIARAKRNWRAER